VGGSTRVAFAGLLFGLSRRRLEVDGVSLFEQPLFQCSDPENRDKGLRSIEKGSRTYTSPATA
jgi:hypothetical protein